MHLLLNLSKVQSASASHSRSLVSYLEAQVSAQYPSNDHSQRPESSQAVRVSTKGHLFLHSAESVSQVQSTKEVQYVWSLVL
jgi:hypothetical protein